MERRDGRIDLALYCAGHYHAMQATSFDLADAVGLVACGGFSYGDVLGAGEGWAKTILFNAQLAEAQKEYASVKAAKASPAVDCAAELQALGK